MMKKGLMIFILVIICVVMSSSLVLADGYCSNEHCAFDQFSCENNCGQCSDSSIYNKNSCLNPGSCDRTDGYGYTINSLNECENVVDCYTFGTTVGTDPVTGDRATNPWGQDIYDSYSCSNDGDCDVTHANGNLVGDQWTCENNIGSCTRNDSYGYTITDQSTCENTVDCYTFGTTDRATNPWGQDIYDSYSCSNDGDCSDTHANGNHIGDQWTCENLGYVWTPVSNNVETGAGVWSITPGTWTPVSNNVEMNAGVWSITPGTWTPVINNVVANQGQWISSHGNTWADASWTFHTCGNWVEPNEQCDDTNSIDGDGCSSSCQLEDGFFCSRTWVSSLNGGAGAYKTVCSDAGQCGNGLDNVVLNIEDQWGNQITETKHCDDGGYCSDNAGECGTAAFPGVTNCGDPGTATCIAQSGDGCNSNCQVEEDAACASNHFSGNAIPSICVPGVVGDGVISSVEQCDVGDNFCQTGCCNGRVQINNGWTCDSSVPSVCAHTCGDGFVNGIGEQCDTGGICDNVAYTTRQACGNNGAGWHIGANDKTEAECTGPDEYFSSSSGYCYAMGCNSDCALQYGYKYDSGTGKTVSASYAEMVAVNLAGIRSIDGLNRWGPEGLSNPNIPVTNCYDGDVIGNACSDTGGWNAGYTCTSDVNQIPMDVCVDSCANGRGSSGYCNVVGGTHSGQCDVSTGGLLVGFNYGDLIVSESIGDGVFTNDHICVWSHYGVGNPYDQVSTQANYEAQNSGNGNGNGGLDCTAGEVNGNCECWGNGVGVGVGCDTYDGSTNGYLDGVCRPDGSDLVCLENMKIYVKSTLAEAADGTNHFDVEDQNSPPPVAIDDTAYHFELGDLDGKSKFILHKDFMGPIDNLFANDFFGIQPGFETFPATIAYTYVSNVGVIPFPKLLAIDAAPGEYICKKNNAHDVPTFINYASIYGASCDEMVSVDNIATSCVVGNDYAGTARTLCGTDLGGGKVLMASLFSGGSVEYCGDGIINGSLGEQCDDGGLCSDNGNECGTVAFPGVTNCANANASCVPQNGDGCNENCQNEGSAAVPEFSDYAIALLLLTVVGGFVAMRRKQY